MDQMYCSKLNSLRGFSFEDFLFFRGTLEWETGSTASHRYWVDLPVNQVYMFFLLPFGGPRDPFPGGLGRGSGAAVGPVGI